MEPISSNFWVKVGETVLRTVLSQMFQHASEVLWHAAELSCSSEVPVTFNIPLAEIYKIIPLRKHRGKKHFLSSSKSH
jgi:hypothetical protein